MPKDLTACGYNFARLTKFGLTKCLGRSLWPNGDDDDDDADADCCWAPPASAIATPPPAQLLLVLLLVAWRWRKLW